MNPFAKKLEFSSGLKKDLGTVLLNGDVRGLFDLKSRLHPSERLDDGDIASFSRYVMKSMPKKAVVWLTNLQSTFPLQADTWAYEFFTGAAEHDFPRVMDDMKSKGMMDSSWLSKSMRFAVPNGSLRSMMWILLNGGDVNAPVEGHVPSEDLLLSGASKFAQAVVPLGLAIVAGNTKMIEFLIDYGAKSHDEDFLTFRQFLEKTPLLFSGAKKEDVAQRVGELRRRLINETVPEGMVISPSVLATACLMEDMDAIRDLALCGVSLSGLDSERFDLLVSRLLKKEKWESLVFVIEDAGERLNAEHVFVAMKTGMESTRRLLGGISDREILESAVALSNSRRLDNDAKAFVLAELEKGSLTKKFGSSKSSASKGL